MAVFGILNFWFVYKLVPETANKTIEENLEQILGKDYIEKDKAFNFVQKTNN